MAVYSLEQLFGKLLRIKSSVEEYTTPENKSGVVLRSGTQIGTIYSYVVRNGIIWLSYDTHDKKTRYIKWDKNVIDTEYFKTQGALSDEQVKMLDEIKNAPPVDAFMKKYGIPAFTTITVIVTLVSFVKIFSKK